MQDVNRLKLVLVEQKKTSKWLSEELGVSPSTVSKWCTNSSQPDIETLARISKLLNIGVEELFNKKLWNLLVIIRLYGMEISKTHKDIPRLLH